MTATARYRLIFGAFAACYAGYLFAIAFIAHLVTDNLLSTTVTEYLWYSLASAAVAVGCWIALGDGSGLVRLGVGLWSLVCVWIVWQASIYVYANYQSGQTGSTSEGFSVYAAGNAVIALVVTVALLAAARGATRFRFMRDPDRGPLIPSRSRFSLADLLCGIAIGAVTLGTARLVAPHDLSYLAWFAKPDAVRNFAWAYTCTAIIVVPTALMLVFPRRYVLAGVYFLCSVTVLLLHQRWDSLSTLSFSAWKFYWPQQVLREVQVLVHVGSILLILKWLGYSFSRKPLDRIVSS